MNIWDLSTLVDRRGVLTAALTLPAASRLLGLPAAPSYLVEYTLATFADSEGWLLSMDDDVAGISDWRDGTLTYDFRRGLAFLGIENRLETLRGSPEALILLLDSDGGGQQLRCRLRDSGGRYFEAAIASLNHPGPQRAACLLHDLGGAAWQVFGAGPDRVPRPPLTVTSIAMSAGSGRPSGRVRLQGLRVRTRLQPADGLRLSFTSPEPDEVTLSVENLLPLAGQLTLAYSLVGLDGAIRDRGGTSLTVPPAGRILHQVSLVSTDLPPVVQISAQVFGRAAVASTHASLVRDRMPAFAGRLTGLGVHAGLSSRVLPREMTRLAASIAGAGVQWIREDFNWQQISSLSSRVSVRRHDQAIEAATGAGLRVLALPTAWPIWTHPYTMRGVREFTSFLGAVARRYRGRIAAWEVWNEPNLPASWGGTLAQYIDLLTATYATLKEIDPSVLVVAPGSVGPGDLSNAASFADLDWIQRFLQYRQPLFDVFSFHPYEGRTSPEQSDLVATVQRLRSILQTAGGPARIWITEQGWASDFVNPALDDVQQARLLVRAYLLSQTAGVELFFWYDTRNDGLALGDHESNFGLLRRDFSAKASYRSLAALAAVVGARHFAGMLPAPDDLYALRFDGAPGQQPVAALWSPRVSTSLAVTVDAGSGTLCDLDGTKTPLSPGSTTVDLPAGLVRFVIGADAIATSSGSSGAASSPGSRP